MILIDCCKFHGQFLETHLKPMLVALCFIRSSGGQQCQHWFRALSKRAKRLGFLLTTMGHVTTVSKLSLLHSIFHSLVSKSYFPMCLCIWIKYCWISLILLSTNTEFDFALLSMTKYMNLTLKMLFPNLVFRAFYLVQLSTLQTSRKGYNKPLQMFVEKRQFFSQNNQWLNNITHH